MITMIRRYPIASYFVLAFGISWLGSALVLGPKFLRSAPYGPADMMLSLLAMLAGPSLAGFTLTRIVDGRDGIRDLFRRMRHWRVGAGWYVVSLLTPPILLLVVFLLLSKLVSTRFVPGFFELGIAYGILAGYLEEIGWMGYAFPKMKLKYGALAASLILGAIHGSWHVVGDYLGSVGAMGSYWFPHFVAQYVAAMTVTRILIAWVYLKTGSVLLAQIFHASSTGFLVALGPAAVVPAEAVLADVCYVAALCLVVVVLAVRYGKRCMQPAASSFGTESVRVSR